MCSTAVDSNYYEHICLYFRINTVPMYQPKPLKKPGWKKIPFILSMDRKSTSPIHEVVWKPRENGGMCQEEYCPLLAGGRERNNNPIIQILKIA